MDKFKILNCYAGIGGNRKLWDIPLKEKFGDNYEITAIELNPEIAEIYKEYFPNDNVIIVDAHEYLLNHFKEFDFIWCSPPCQSHTKLNTMLNANGINRYPDMKLYQEIILLQKWYYGKFVIENVKPYYDVLIKPQVIIDRHLFWTNIKTLGKKIEHKRQSHMSINNKSIVFNYDLTKYKIKSIKKEQILKNMVNPEVGLQFLNRVLEIKEANNIKEQELFNF